MSHSSSSRTLSAIVLSLILALAGSRSSISAEEIDAAKGERLVGDRLKEAFSGGYYYIPYGSIEVGLQFSPDGEMNGDAAGSLADNGKWWIQEDRLCRKWFGPFIEFGPENCFAVFLDGNVMTWYYPDGSLGFKGRYMK